MRHAEKRHYKIYPGHAPQNVTHSILLLRPSNEGVAYFQEVVEPFVEQHIDAPAPPQLRRVRWVEVLENPVAVRNPCRKSLREASIAAAWVRSNRN